MRKLLALLLALMLPVCALADSNQLTFEVQADTQAFPAWAQILLNGLGHLTDEATERYAKAIGTLLQDLRIRVTTENDATAVTVVLASSELMDVVIRDAGDVAYVSSSLIPGYAMTLDKQDAALPFLEEYDWTDLGAEIKSTINTWFSGVESTKTYGVFNGDAYTGGTQCTSWVIDDQDIVQLVSSVMNPKIRSLISDILNHSGMDSETALKQLDEQNSQVSKDNTHRYLVRLVQTDKAEFVGVSITITKDASQLATVSFGVEADGLRLVVGMGLNSGNYWWEYHIQKKQKNHLTLLKGESREWTAPKDAAFAYVQETCVPAAAHVWSCNLTKSGSRILWDGSAYSGLSAAAEDKSCVYKGALNTAESSFNAELSLLASSRTPLKIRITGESGNEISPMDPSVTICSLTADEDQEIVKQLSARISVEMMARLMKMLPLDVIITLGELLAQ